MKFEEYLDSLRNKSVAVIGISDEWCEIWYNNQRAYMSSQYLKTPTTGA